MKIYITRHGQTEWNALGKLQGRKDIELNEVGRKQAEMTRDKLKNEKVDLIISSSLKRAKQTAEIINKEFNVDILEDERLVERGYGDFEGITKIELKEMKKKIQELMRLVIILKIYLCITWKQCKIYAKEYMTF